MFVLGALAVTGAELAPAVVLTGAAFASFYLFNGAGWPPLKALMHWRVDATRRSPTVSASSFALMIGGVAGSLLVPRLAEATSLTTAIQVGAIPLLLAALPALGPRAASATAPAALDRGLCATQAVQVAGEFARATSCAGPPVRQSGAVRARRFQR